VKRYIVAGGSVNLCRVNETETSAKEATMYDVCEVPYSRKTAVCSPANYVDIVGVTGSIPVTPTIQTHTIQRLGGTFRLEYVVAGRFRKPVGYQSSAAEAISNRRA
jgi:hypothetical protein